MCITHKDWICSCDWNSRTGKTWILWDVCKQLCPDNLMKTSVIRLLTILKDVGCVISTQVESILSYNCLRFWLVLAWMTPSQFCCPSVILSSLMHFGISMFHWLPEHVRTLFDVESPKTKPLLQEIVTLSRSGSSSLTDPSSTTGRLHWIW